jgi:hypothetical protein
MDNWPEFVKEAEERLDEIFGVTNQTRWEPVRFELEDAYDGGSSDFSTAALAP